LNNHYLYMDNVNKIIENYYIYEGTNNNVNKKWYFGNIYHVIEPLLNSLPPYHLWGSSGTTKIIFDYTLPNGMKTSTYKTILKSINDIEYYNLNGK
jgi:hypothetical protein